MNKKSSKENRLLLRKTGRLLGTLVLSLVIAFLFRQWEQRQPSALSDLSADLGYFFSNQQELIRQIRQSLLCKDKRIKIRFNLQGDVHSTLEDLAKRLWSEALEPTDNPQEGDYLRYQLGGYRVVNTQSVGEEGYAYQVTLEPIYYTTLTQEEAVTQKVKDWVEWIRKQEVEKEVQSKGVPDGETEERQRRLVRQVHDLLCEQVAYDQVHRHHKNHHLNATAYAAFILKTASCQGYSVATYRLLKELGIPCRIVTGQVTNPDGTQDYHAWNLVQIGSEWLNLDVTWDDLLETEDFFLKPDGELKDRVRSER